MITETKQDVFTEEDDFTFGETKKEDRKEPEKIVDTADSDFEDDAKTDVDKDTDKATDQIKDAGADDQKKVADYGKKADADKKDKVDDTDNDIFTDGSDKEEKLSLKKLASGLEIDLEKDDEEEFKTKIKEKLDKSRQEFNLDEYPEDAKKVIKHLKENGGKLEDFLNNKTISSLQGVVSLAPEDKVRQVRTTELRNAGLAPAKAREQAETEIEGMSSKELKNLADQIDEDAHKLISEEITKVVGDRKSMAEQDRIKANQRVEKEVREVKNYIETQKEFLGIPITDKAKQSIMIDIESGAFDDIANKAPAASKFAAYMFAKFGTKINDTLKKTALEQNRKGHNAATDRDLSALHKTKETAAQSGTGHQKANKGNAGKFDGFGSAFDD